MRLNIVLFIVFFLETELTKEQTSFVHIHYRNYQRISIWSLSRGTSSSSHTSRRSCQIWSSTSEPRQSLSSSAWRRECVERSAPSLSHISKIFTSSMRGGSVSRVGSARLDQNPLRHSVQLWFSTLTSTDRVWFRNLSGVFFHNCEREL